VHGKYVTHPSLLSVATNAKAGWLYKFLSLPPTDEMYSKLNQIIMKIVQTVM